MKASLGERPLGAILGVLITLGAALFGAGCTVGPNYHLPESNPPGEWSEAASGGEAERSASLAAWWKNFSDAELDSLVERALSSNLDPRIARARVREARAERGVASAGLWPRVDASGSYARARESANQPLLGALLPPGVPLENNVYQAGFDASWELDVFGGTRRAVEAADAEIAAAVYGREDVRVTLIAEVARRYVEARGFQERLSIAQANIEAQQDAVALARDRFQHGLTSNLDAEQAATVLSQTEARVPTLEAGIKTSIHRLGVLLGQPPGALLAELETAAPIPAALPNVPVGLPSELLRRRPDIRVAERELAAATARIGVATAELFPKFSLTGAAGFESVSASDWFTAGSRFWSVGPTVQWRIFDAGRIRANIHVRNARQEQALAAYEKTVLTSFEDVENALVAYAKEKTRNLALEEAVRRSRNSLRIARERYANGVTNFIDVLDLVRSRQEVSQDVIALYKALGGGWEGAAPDFDPSRTAEATEKSEEGR
jgi:NodT family efflux transporter outer membrane factor (OMF) lipoprotein